MSSYSNPTANAAIGSVDREIKFLYTLARKIRDNRLSPEQASRARRNFVGIYRHILTDVYREKANRA